LLHSQNNILAAVPPSPPEATIGRVLSKIWFHQQERNQQQGSARRKLNEMAASGGRLFGVEEEQVYRCPEFFYIIFDFDLFQIDDVFVFYSNWDIDALVHFDFSLFLLFFDFDSFSHASQQRVDRPWRTEGTRREKTAGETDPLTGGAHLSGRTKNLC
jgi:hypothetical protein